MPGRPSKGPRLGTGPSHQKRLVSGLAAALFREERIQTTEARAKRLRPVAERLITLGKSGGVHARRQALKWIEDRDVVHKLFSEIAPRYEGRDGGYLRILKLGPRKGDAAPMALVELVEELETEPASSSQQPSSKRRRRRRRQPAKAETAASEETEPSKEGAQPKAEVEAQAPQPKAEVPSEESDGEEEIQKEAESGDEGEDSGDPEK